MAKKKAAILGVSSILLVAMVVAVAVGVTRKNGQAGSDGSGGAAPAGNADISTSSKAVQTICQPTDYKETCEKSLSSANTSDPKQLIMAAFTATVDQIREAIKSSAPLKGAASDPRTKEALEICEEVLDDSIDDLQRSFDKFKSFELNQVGKYLNDLETWLYGAIVYQETCLDAFENTTGDTGEKMKKILKLSRELSSNGLAMVTEVSKLMNSVKIPSSSRRLLSNEDGFPSWVSAGRRRLLAATPASVQPNVVVAQDGSGKYKTIAEALKEVPQKTANNATFVIYIKAGIYAERVNLTKKMPNVYMIGDGPTKTRITGNRSFKGGYNTFMTSTFSVDGDHFMAKDIGFENSAGPEGHQAVALRVTSDRAVLFNCQMDGYQDTLYAHNHRQFYRDCTISGTVDFIFGDATAIFQNCRLVIRKPLDNQSCMVTAQGKQEPRGNSGTVIQNCIITATPEYMAVKGKFKSYLGRPWKKYAKTIVMQSQIDDVIDPTGWFPWQVSATEVVNIDSCYYSEFNNRGPGSNTAARVTWPGIKKIDAQVASTFTAKIMLAGDSWIPATGVPYVSGM